MPNIKGKWAQASDSKSNTIFISCFTAIMRSISLLKGALLPYVGVLISNLASKLGTVSKVGTFVSCLNHTFTEIEMKKGKIL